MSEWISVKERLPENDTNMKIMTYEEAARRIAEHMVAHHIGEYPHFKLCEALKMALAALRAQQEAEKNEPHELIKLASDDTVARPPTNADRIRAMSNEEMAELFYEVTLSSCNAICGVHNARKRNSTLEYMIKNQYLKWLYRPAEEDDHGQA